MSAAPSEWKEEPVSPLNEDASWLSEETLYFSNFEHPDFKLETENDDTACETKAEIASKLLDNLDQLEDLDEWIKNEGLYLKKDTSCLCLLKHKTNFYCNLKILKVRDLEPSSFRDAGA